MSGGGGGGSYTSTDPAYNAGMLGLAQEQNRWAEEMFNMFKYGVTYNPYEMRQGYYINMKTGQVTTADDPDAHWFDKSSSDLGSIIENIRANPQEPEWGPGINPGPPQNELHSVNQQGLVGGNRYGTTDANIPGGPGGDKRVGDPPDDGGLGLPDDSNPDPYGLGQAQNKWAWELMGYNPDDHVSQMDYMQALVGANMDLLGLQTDLDKGGMRAIRDLGGIKTDLARGFLQEAMQGLDYGEEMDRAQAGVQHGFKNADRAMAMELGRYGLDPSSGMYSGMMRNRNLAEATGIAGARQGAYDRTRDENWRRKIQGLALNTADGTFYMGDGATGGQTASGGGFKTPGLSETSGSGDGGMSGWQAPPTWGQGPSDPYKDKKSNQYGGGLELH